MSEVDTIESYNVGRGCSLYTNYPRLVMTCLYPMEICVLQYDVMALKPLSANYKLRNGGFSRRKERKNECRRCNSMAYDFGGHGCFLPSSNHNALLIVQ